MSGAECYMLAEHADEAKAQTRHVAAKSSLSIDQPLQGTRTAPTLLCVLPH